MLDKKLVISIVAMFVLAVASGAIVHGTILQGEYMKLSFMRPEAQAHGLFAYMFLANFLFACGFSWIYVRGKEAKPWMGQGLRYGIAIILLYVLPTYLVYYVILPMPSGLVAQQIIFDSISTIVLALVLAWLNR
jgi:hypothetical protein